jgi:hypothetical protein
MPVLNFDTKADLAAYDAAVDSIRYCVYGNNAIGDVPVKYYTYYENMSEPADGEYIIEATGMSGGRYLLYDTMGGRDFFTYVGRTDINGDYSITYVNPFFVTPHVQPKLITSDHLKIVTLVSSDESSCVINVKKIVTQVVEQVEWLTADTTNVQDELVTVVVISR